jgi:hypothetical protein
MREFEQKAVITLMARIRVLYGVIVIVGWVTNLQNGHAKSVLPMTGHRVDHLASRRTGVSRVIRDAVVREHRNRLPMKANCPFGFGLGPP